MNSLPVFLRLSGRPVILIGEGDTAEAKRRLLVRAGAKVVHEDSDAALAIVAIAEDAEAEAAVSRLRARGILVNAVDRPGLCDFTLPAIVDRDPVLVAIGTGGASAGLAKALRQQIEALLPSSLGKLAERLHDARHRLRATLPEAADRRRAIDEALRSGGPLNPLEPASVDRVAGWLENPAAPPGSTLVIIQLRSTDPDDLTLREARWLAVADTVFYDGQVPAAILHRVRADANRIQAPVPNELSAGLTVYMKGLA